MKLTSLRRLLSLAFAALFISAAGAAETEQVLLNGDELIYEADYTEYKEIDGVPIALKTFIVSPETDPGVLREDPFVKDGYKFVYDRMDREEQTNTDSKIAEEIYTMDAKTNDLASALPAFPGVMTYDKDGYSGELELDTKSVQFAVSQYNNITDSQPHTVTKVYSTAYNDRTLIPDSVQADGLELPLVDLSWKEEPVTPGSDVPTGWRATAVYSKTTYTKRQEASLYRATATYRGQVSKTELESVKYIVRYKGEKLPVIPKTPDIHLPTKDAAQSGANVFLNAALQSVPYLLFALCVLCLWSASQRHTRLDSAETKQNRRSTKKR